VKEKRWVVFKGEHDPTSIPVEWICWLNGQRKRAPTPEHRLSKVVDVSCHNQHF
ncbi:NADH ubiquinone oxidoreductase, partial [Trifolium pratense]